MKEALSNHKAFECYCNCSYYVGEIDISHTCRQLHTAQYLAVITWHGSEPPNV